MAGSLETVVFPPQYPRKIQTKGILLEFTAKQKGKLIGGLVAYQTIPAEIEIRHLAVSPEFHRQGTGSSLVRHLLSYASETGCTRVYTIARNTSVDFFKKLALS
jgi:N-acetylglutamate synthase-like GNAT family acetyltransferase